MRYLFTLIKSPWNVNVLLQNMVIPLLSSSAHAKRRTAQEEKAMDRSTCATLGTWPIKDTSGVKVKGRAIIHINRRLTIPGANSRALQWQGSHQKSTGFRIASDYEKVTSFSSKPDLGFGLQPQAAPPPPWCPPLPRPPLSLPLHRL